jgi:hypothetical protein
VEIKPKIPHKVAIIEAAIKTGKYQVCPEFDPQNPAISEPIHNPTRNDQVVVWVPEQFSYQVADGATFFCELLQSGDPTEPWTVTPETVLTAEDF